MCKNKNTNINKNTNTKMLCKKYLNIYLDIIVKIKYANK